MDIKNYYQDHEDVIHDHNYQHRSASFDRDQNFRPAAGPGQKILPLHYNYQQKLGAYKISENNHKTYTHHYKTKL